MKKTTYIILISLFFGCKTENKSNPNIINDSENITQKGEQNFEEKYVTAISGLNYRKKPKGKIIGKFKYGEKLNIIEHTNVFETINDDGEIKEDQWLGVKVNNEKVYVFGGYLSNEKINDHIEISNNSQKKQIAFEILLPNEYRDWENKNPSSKLNQNWQELYQKGGKYYLDKADYTIKKGYSECSGDSTRIIQSKRKTLLFINDSNLNSGELYSKIINKNKVWPKEKILFSYKNIEYKIRAEGEIISSEEVHSDKGLEFYANVKNYKLYISTNNNFESLFLEELGFNDTFVKLLFVGDIDSDGKLDFIFEANRDYEEERVILYLSSKATQTEIIKKVGEIAIQFDC